MTTRERLDQFQAECGGEFMNFGPPPEQGGVAIAASFGAYEPEYAAIRQRVGVMHLPQRGVLRLTGADRGEFLHNMLTRNVRALAPGSTRPAFQLNAKGRIVADVMLHHGEADTWLETDALDLDPLRELLDGRLFAEDVQLEDFSDQRVKLALHGPASVALLQALTDADSAEAVQRASQMAGTHHVVALAGRPVTLYRRDDAGAVGLHLLVPSDAAVELYQKLLDAAGFDPRADVSPDADYAQRRRQTLRGRPIGWLAYNTARIEAGTPIFHVDFGRDSLPAETGVIDEAVDFDKGCYIGQEIVARMRNLGHPKRLLVGLRFDDDRLPVARAQVMRPGEGDNTAEPGLSADIVGGVTSSTLSPLLGQCAIAFAVVKWGMHEPGTRVRVAADGAMTEGHVHALRFIGPT